MTARDLSRGEKDQQVERKIAEVFGEADETIDIRHLVADRR
jgi:hypothetical protein